MPHWTAPLPEPLYRRGRLIGRLLAVEVLGKQRPGAHLDGVDVHAMGSKHEIIFLYDLELRGRIAVGAVWADRVRSAVCSWESL